MQARPPSTIPEPHATSAGNQYDLPALIDIALSNNPDTQQTWEQARAAAAAYGASRAPYYPVVSAQVPGGYEREIFELPGQNAVLKQWQITPMIEFTYTLLDFGRRDAGAAAARAQLAAANFSFNRKLQDVVFATQRAFYSIGAAKAAVQAAEAKRRAGEDRRRGRQPPRRSRAGHRARAAALAPDRRAIAVRSRQRASAGARSAGEHGRRAGRRRQHPARRAEPREPPDSRRTRQPKWIN